MLNCGVLFVLYWVVLITAWYLKRVLFAWDSYLTFGTLQSQKVAWFLCEFCLQLKNCWWKHNLINTLFLSFSVWQNGFTRFRAVWWLWWTRHRTNGSDWRVLWIRPESRLVECSNLRRNVVGLFPHDQVSCFLSFQALSRPRSFAGWR